MESLLFDVNWLAVVVGTIVSFIFGWLWYSDKMFGRRWRDAIGIPVDDNTPMMNAMITQLVGTFLLAWVIAVAAVLESLQLAVLVAITITVIIKANGFFAQKRMYAIKVESGFVLAMVVVMIAIHVII